MTRFIEGGGSRGVDMGDGDQKRAETGGIGRSRWAVAPIAALVIALVLVAAQLAGWSLGDDWFRDQRMRLFSKPAPSQHKDLAVVLIDEDTVMGLPYRTPIDRELIANLVTAADKAGAKAIGLDFILDQKTEAAKDEMLLKAVRDARAKVVLRREAVPVTRASWQEEFIRNADRPAGHVVYVSPRDALGANLAARLPLARTAAAAGSDQTFAGLLAVAKREAPREEPRPLIDWLWETNDGTDPIMQVSAANLLSRGPGGEGVAAALGNLLRDRVVLIGGNLFDRDQYATLITGNEANTPGVLIHAHIVAQLIDGRRIVLLPPQYELLLLFAAAFLGCMLGWRRRFRRLEVVSQLIGLALFLAVSCGAFWAWKLIIPVTTPLYAWLAGVTAGRYTPLILRWAGTAWNRYAKIA